MPGMSGTADLFLRRGVCKNYLSLPRVYNIGKVKLNFCSLVVAAILKVIPIQTWAKASISALGQH